VDLLPILNALLPKLPLILVDTDRIGNVITSIAANLIGPVLRAKSFPDNLTADFLSLLQQLTRTSQAAKTWRKDVLDALADLRFFATPVTLIKTHWLPIIAQLNTQDKSLFPDLLSRISAPTTAGIMFGVGATSARLEADRRTQLILRRLALLVLAAAQDTFTPHLPLLEDKFVELLTATPASSPSSATRAELFMLLCALLLRTSPIHLAPLWPLLHAELGTAIAAALPSSEGAEKYNGDSVVQACKVLDLLVALEGDEWQLREWTFVTDTIDAVYRPPGLSASALVEEVAEGLGAEVERLGISLTPAAVSAGGFGGVGNEYGGAEGKRRPILDGMIKALRMEGVHVEGLGKQELAVRVLRPFLGQLGIVAFEATYGMLEIDLEACLDSLLEDLCEEGAA